MRLADRYIIGVRKLTSTTEVAQFVTGLSAVRSRRYEFERAHEASKTRAVVRADRRPPPASRGQMVWPVRDMGQLPAIRLGLVHGDGPSSRHAGLRSLEPLLRNTLALMRTATTLRAEIESGGYLVDVYALSVARTSPPGSFYYDRYSHRLVRLNARPPAKLLAEALPYLIKSPAWWLVLSGSFARGTDSDGERAYRTALLAAGRLGQKIVAYAQASATNVVWVERFDDDGLNQQLRIDGVTEAALLCLGLSWGPIP